MGKPKNKKSKATEPWEDSKERSTRIARRVEVLLVDGYRCLSQAQIQAERMIDNKKHLKKSELNKIKAECEDECCHPCEELRHEYVHQRLEYEHKRMPLHEKEEELPFPVLNYYGPQECPGSSRSATSSAIRGSVNTAIPEAATEHSEGPEAAKKDERAIPKAATEHSDIRRLLTLANENSQSGEAVTEHSEIPETACQQAKRLRKSEKETKQSLYTDTVRFYNLLGYSVEDSEYYARCQEALSEIPEEKNATVPQPEALDEQCKPNRKATLSREYSQPILRRIHRRIRVLKDYNYKCFSQTLYQAESQIVSNKLLTQIELDKIKADCKDKCCNPPSSSGGATSSAILGSINKAIPEATTEDKTPIPEAATEHSESSKATKEDKTAIPEAATNEKNTNSSSCYRALPKFKSY